MIESAGSGPQLLADLLSHCAGPVGGADLEADSPYPRVSTASITLADGGQVVLYRLRRPGIGTYRNLGPEAGSAHRYCVGGVREQIIRNELVVAFQVVSNQIEENHSVAGLRALLDEIDGLHMALIQRSVKLLDFRLLNDLAQLAAPHPADDFVNDLGAF